MVEVDDEMMTRFPCACKVEFRRETVFRFLVRGGPLSLAFGDVPAKASFFDAYHLRERPSPLNDHFQVH